MRNKISACAYIIQSKMTDLLNIWKLMSVDTAVLLDFTTGTG